MAIKIVLITFLLCCTFSSSSHASKHHYSIAQFLSDCQNQKDLDFKNGFHLNYVDATLEEQKCLRILHTYFTTLTMVSVGLSREIYLDKEENCQVINEQNMLVGMLDECNEKVEFAHQVVNAGIPCIQNVKDFFGELKVWYERWLPNIKKENAEAVLVIHTFLQDEYACSNFIEK